MNNKFSKLTTLRIGGPIKYFVKALTVGDVKESIKKAKSENLPWVVIGGASNLLVSDSGFSGVVIENSITGIHDGVDIIKVGAGTDLQELVEWTIENAVAGFEKLIGIPGTVGGAVFGNAGAYGQIISDNILWVEVFDSKSLSAQAGGKTKKLTKEECDFNYRESRFKKTREIIVWVGFKKRAGEQAELRRVSKEILAVRLQRYPLGISCPGSFFKNIEADTLPPDILKKIPKEKIMYGKIPAGWLLEEVGAKGQKRGGVEVASWHGNLIINKGEGRASDFIELAKYLQGKVKKRFGIELVPEVRLIGFNDDVFN